MRRLLFTVLFFFLIGSLSVSQAAYITDKLVAGLYKEAKVSDKPIKALNSGTPLEVVSRNNGFVKVRTSDGTIGWVEATYLTDEKPARSILLDTQAKVSILQKQLEQLKGMQASGDTLSEDPVDWQDRLAKAQGQISQLQIQLQAEKLNSKKLQDSQQLFDREKQQLVADMQARTETAMQALQQENLSLQAQIQKVAEILNIPAAQTPEDAGVDSNQAIAPSQKDIQQMLSDYFLWALLGIGLLLGFAGGFYYMRHKVTQRFGSVFRL
jgi:hypothetical protein